MPAPTKVQLTGGAFQDSEGNKLALGYLIMYLSADENISGVGNIVSGRSIRIQLDSNGDVVASPAQSVWGNDQMLPANSYYRVTGYTEVGQPAWGPNNQQVNGDGGTFDVGTWVPNQVISWTPSVQAVEIEVNTVAADSQTLLDFTDSDTVTFEDLGSGQITAHAGASGPPTPVEILAAMQPLRIWKAISNSGSLGNNVGLQPNLTAASNGLIAATATQTNFNTMLTSAVASNQASVSFNSLNAYGINPNVGQIWSTQTLKAAKWQAALVDTANVRVWMVLADIYITNMTQLVGDTPNLNLIGFRYSTAAGDTHWKAVCGVGGTLTVVDTGIAIDTLGHQFGIAVSQTSITFQIDGVTVATITTHIPANTVRFGDFMSIDNIGLTNVKSVAYAAFQTSE
jgi:hypothetical protein